MYAIKKTQTESLTKTNMELLLGKDQITDLLNGNLNGTLPILRFCINRKSSDSASFPPRITMIQLYWYERRVWTLQDLAVN